MASTMGLTRPQGASMAASFAATAYPTGDLPDPTDDIFHENYTLRQGLFFMDHIYEKLKESILRDQVNSIQGFSRSWTEPVIYIYTLKHRTSEAQAYIETWKDSLGTHLINSVRFVYTDQGGSAKFVSLRPGNGVRHETGEPKASWATITCFLFSQDVGDESVWAMTVGHLVDQQMHEYQYDTAPGCAVGLMNDGHERKRVMFSDSYKSALLDKLSFVDATLYRVSEKALSEGILDEQIPFVDVSPKVSRAAYPTFLNRTVFKTGLATGYTKGIISEVDICKRIQGILCAGLFIVTSKLEQPFANVTDSGSAVIDKKTQEVIGFVVGITTEHDVLCVRLDTHLQFFHEMWKLKLDLNRVTSAGTHTDEDLLTLGRQHLTDLQGIFEGLELNNKQLRKENSELRKRLQQVVDSDLNETRVKEVVDDQIEQAPAEKAMNLSDSESGALMKQPGHSQHVNYEPVMFCKVGQQEELDFIQSIDRAPPDQVVSAYRECLSETSATLPQELSSVSSNGHSFMCLLKESSLKPKLIVKILKTHGLGQAKDIFLQGMLKESIYKAGKSVNFEKFMFNFEDIDLPQHLWRPIVACEFQGEREDKLRNFLSGINNMTVLQQMYHNVEK